jgi:hypothetical protein
MLATDEAHYKLWNDFKNSCKWAAITCVVVTVPIIGKVAQVSIERSLGTIIGGRQEIVASTPQLVMQQR